MQTPTGATYPPLVRTVGIPLLTTYSYGRIPPPSRSPPLHLPPQSRPSALHPRKRSRERLGAVPSSHIRRFRKPVRAAGVQGSKTSLPTTRTVNKQGENVQPGGGVPEHRRYHRAAPLRLRTDFSRCCRIGRGRTPNEHASLRNPRWNA